MHTHSDEDEDEDDGSCLDEIRQNLRLLLKLPAVDICVLVYSLTYLLIILVDLLMDEFQCACSLELVDPSASDSACADRLWYGADSCLSLRFIDEKNRVGVLVDFVFLWVFFAEVLLRIFAQGRSYFSGAPPAPGTAPSCARPPTAISPRQTPSTWPTSSSSCAV